jgi:4-amino-4-deoxy-L-arabinose transferase-like glycosyltransferase
MATGKIGPAVGLLALAILAALLALLPHSPSRVILPDRDQGVFLYAGQQMLDGKLLYREVWDHKPPLIHVLYALGQMIGGRWGVWALEVISLAAAGALAFLGLRRAVGGWAAGLAVAGGLFSLAPLLVESGLTEEFGLPWQFAGLLAFLKLVEGRPTRGWGLLFGLSAGVALLWKQSLVGVWLAAGLYWLLRAALSGRRLEIPGLGWMALGAMLPLAITGLAFAAQGGLADLWDAVVSYNLAYSEVGVLRQVQALAYQVKRLRGFGPFYLAGLVSWVWAGLYLLLRDPQARAALRRRSGGWLAVAFGLQFGLGVTLPLARQAGAWQDLAELQGLALGLLLLGLLLGTAWLSGTLERVVLGRSERWHRPGAGVTLHLARWAFLALPVELWLLAFSGRTYEHYSIALLPALMALAGLALRSLTHIRAGNRRLAGALYAIAALAFILPHPVLAQNLAISPDVIQRQAVVTYLEAETRPTDGVLFWGGETGLYWVTGRRAPTRFAYQYPLYTSGYTRLELWEQLLVELRQDPPRLIIDSLSPYTPLLVADGPVERETNVYVANPPGLETFTAWLQAEYRPVERLGPEGWVVYQRVNPD